MRSYLLKIIFTVFVLKFAAVTAQVKFTATASAQQISKNEMVQLRLAVENAQSVEQITPSVFSNFIIVSGPNQESGMTSINGVVKQYVALNYILKPKGPGNFTIPAATAKADGKDYRSNTVTVKVTNTNAPNANTGSNSVNPLTGFNPFEDAPQQTPFTDYILKKGESAAEKINRNMFVKLQTDKTACYIGEPVLATYKLYTRLKSESNVVKNPSFSGFSVVDLQVDNMNIRRETVNGREYNVYTIRKVQLYPLQAGNLELEPLQVENNVQFIKEAYANRQSDLMNDVFQEFAEAAIPPEGIESQKITLQSKPVNIIVKALPAEGAPATFNGAVGKFTIEAGIEKNNFTTDDAGKLQVTIQGEGNLQLVTAPDIKWPQGIEAFEPVATEDITKTTVPVSGRKMLSWDFTAAAAGDYVLPAIVFSYFDPASSKYKTDSVKPIKFTVTKGTGKKVNITAPAEEKKSWLNNFFSNRRWVVSTVAALIALVLLFWLKRDKRKEEKQVKAAAAAQAIIEEPAEIPVKEEKNYLENAKILLQDNSAGFYKELNAALKNYLADKLELPAATLNKKIITEGLDKKNVSTATVIQLQELMNAIELQLYTPFAAQEKMQEHYNATAGIIQLLETYKS